MIFYHVINWNTLTSVCSCDIPFHWKILINTMIKSQIHSKNHESFLYKFSQLQRIHLILFSIVKVQTREKSRKTKKEIFFFQYKFFSEQTRINKKKKTFCFIKKCESIKSRLKSLTPIIIKVSRKFRKN